MADNNGGSNAKAFGGVLAIVAVVAGVYAMVEPMNQRMDFLTNRIECLSNEISDAAERERENLALLAKFSVQFTESETQFRGISARLESVEDWRTWWNREWLTANAIQTEKIKNLERMQWGPVNAQISGE